jgi:hypothetical protein
MSKNAMKNLVSRLIDKYGFEEAYEFIKDAEPESLHVFDLFSKREQLSLLERPKRSISEIFDNLDEFFGITESGSQTSPQVLTETTVSVNSYYQPVCAQIKTHQKLSSEIYNYWSPNVSSNWISFTSKPGWQFDNRKSIPIDRQTVPLIAA